MCMHVPGKTVVRADTGRVLPEAGWMLLRLVLVLASVLPYFPCCRCIVHVQCNHAYIRIIDFLADYTELSTCSVLQVSRTSRHNGPYMYGYVQADVYLLQTDS